MTLMNIEINEQRVKEICNNYAIKELALFGSALRSDFDTESDIDLLVEFRPDSGISLFDIVDLKNEFEKVFGREVDIVSKTAIKRSRNHLRRKGILENYKVIYAS
jgi:predicted nucleotidyltransferase